MSVPSRILEAVEIGGAVAAFGYMAARSHWNYLGVTTIPGIGADRYMMEAYSIAIGELPAALLIMIGLGITAFIAWVIARLARRARSIDAKFRWAEPHAVRFLPWLLLLLIVVSQFRLLQVVSVSDQPARCRSDVAIGSIDELVRASCDTRRPTASFYVLATLCVIAGIVTRFRGPSSGDPRRVWYGVMTASVILALQLPTLYGLAVKRARFPGVSIRQTGTSTPRVGLLLLQTSDAVELWTIEKGAGRIVSVPSGQIDSLAMGRVCDLFEVARSQAVTRPPSLAGLFGVEP